MSASSAVTRDPARTYEMDLFDRINFVMRHADVQVQELAEYLGVARTTVSNWRSGRITPSVQSLRLIALRTGYDFNWLTTGCAPRDLNPEPTDSVVLIGPWGDWAEGGDAA